MPRPKKSAVRGFSIVKDEPPPIPEPNVEVISTEVVPPLDEFREEIISEYKQAGTIDSVLDLLYKKYEERAKSSETAYYVSEIQNLNLQVEVLRPAADGQVKVQHVIVEFRRGRFETQDMYLIKALERHPNYGGRGDETTTNSKSYLFWRDTFPTWKWEEIAVKEAELSPVPRED